jgi:hypothetical protein
VQITDRRTPWKISSGAETVDWAVIIGIQPRNGSYRKHRFQKFHSCCCGNLFIESCQSFHSVFLKFFLDITKIRNNASLSYVNTVWGWRCRGWSRDISSCDTDCHLSTFRDLYSDSESCNGMPDNGYYSLIVNWVTEVSLQSCCSSNVTAHLGNSVP